MGKNTIVKHNGEISLIGGDVMFHSNRRENLIYKKPDTYWANQPNVDF